MADKNDKFIFDFKGGRCEETSGICNIIKDGS